MNVRTTPGGSCGRLPSQPADKLGSPEPVSQKMASSHSRERAGQLDSEDHLAFLREEFNIPSKAQIASTRLADKSGQWHTLKISISVSWWACFG